LAWTVWGVGDPKKGVQDSVSFGGGHEKGLRPGTVNVPGVVGMSEALIVGMKLQKTESERLRQLSSVIISTVKSSFPMVRVNGLPENKLAHNLNLTIPGVEAKALIHILKDKLSFSAGSACSTTKEEPSSRGHLILSVPFKCPF
jgi:cysteine desulfurase